MDNREQQLERFVDSIKEFEPPKAPPVFELFASLLSISLGIMLLLLPEAFQQKTVFWNLMNAAVAPLGWTLWLFAGGLLSALGMLMDSVLIRIVGLVLLSGAYSLLSAFYIITFPNFGGVLMFWIAVFTISSIPLVKHTGIRS